MRIKKGMSLTIVIMLCVMLVLSACSKKEAATPSAAPSAAPAESAAVATEAPVVEATPEPVATAAPLEKVVLNFVLLGEAPVDYNAVMAEVNKKLEQDINATIETKFIPFGDIETKYPLVLASQQDWDVIYGNIHYGENASKGGYREILMDDVKKLMPLTDKATTAAQWGDTLVGGKIYMIPQSFVELGVGSGFYREDLRVKYNVPEIKKAQDLEALFQAVKDNEKGIAPFDGTADDIRGLFAMMVDGWLTKRELPQVFNFNPDNKEFKVSGLMDPDFVPIYTAAAKTMKSWVDKGLLPKNAFAQKTSAYELSRVGKTAYWGNAFENYVNYEAEMKAKGWALGAIPALTPNGTGTQRPATGNGFAFSPKSKNYERALMAIDLLHQDKSYNMLLAFGVEGKNYVMNAEGKLALAPGIDASKNPYPMYQAGWWSNNRDQWPPLENYSEGYINMKKDLQAHAVSYLLDGFNVNTDKFKTEVANINNVIKQYAAPIELGIVKDVDKAVAELVDKLKKAGADKVMDEMKLQAAQFVKDHTLQ
ncbi:DUF3502 domain-containing protein [Paenibacillus psychroresistens]|uniref:DUF3502 domain-containing protein n=1 Tax=Paenibacillus psychroresistens TaxID=1778678 RepID=A0A6B8RPL1_9BACL|nr:ABC transporter substrate-binding protein [Paenibacillus psychroresistens]QGQ98301.1 DUF3502 domain-containing protein [Paenibacillus psychroresistens]